MQKMLKKQKKKNKNYANQRRMIKNAYFMIKNASNCIMYFDII